MTTEEEVERILRYWWQKIRLMRRRVWVILGVLIYLLVRADPFLASIDFCIAIAALAWFLGPSVRTLNERRKRPHACVLWIRRFKRGGQSRTVLRFWQAAVIPWGQVLTLTDQDVRVPHLAILLSTSICATVVPIVLIMFRSQLSGSMVLILVVFLVMYALLLSFLILFAVTRLSTARVRNLAQLDRVTTQIRRLKTENLFQLSLGVKLVRCPPDDQDVWRAAITRLAPEVGLVILDCGEAFSTNLEWETKTLVATSSRERLVVAIPERISRSVADLELLKSAISKLTGSLPPIVYYPDRLPVIMVSRRFEAIIRPVQHLIGVAVIGEQSRKIIS